MSTYDEEHEKAKARVNVINALCNFRIEQELNDNNEIVLVAKWPTTSMKETLAIMHETFWHRLIATERVTNDDPVFRPSTKSLAYYHYFHRLFSSRTITKEIAHEAIDFYRFKHRDLEGIAKNAPPKVDTVLAIISWILGCGIKSMIGDQTYGHMRLHPKDNENIVRQELVEVLKDIEKQLYAMKSMTDDNVINKDALSTIHHYAPQLNKDARDRITSLRVAGRDIHYQLSDFVDARSSLQNVFKELSIDNFYDAYHFIQKRLVPVNPSDLFDGSTLVQAIDLFDGGRGILQEPARRAIARYEYNRRIDQHLTHVEFLKTLAMGARRGINLFIENPAILSFNAFEQFKYTVLIRPHEFQEVQLNMLISTMLHKSREEAGTGSKAANKIYRDTRKNTIAILMDKYSAEYTYEQYDNAYMRFLLKQSISCDISRLKQIPTLLFKYDGFQRDGATNLRDELRDNVIDTNGRPAEYATGIAYIREFDTFLPIEPYIWNRAVTVTSGTYAAMRKLAEDHSRLKETFLALQLSWDERGPGISSFLAEFMPLSNATVVDGNKGIFVLKDHNDLLVQLSNASRVKHIADILSAVSSATIMTIPVEEIDRAIEYARNIIDIATHMREKYGAERVMTRTERKALSAEQGEQKKPVKKSIGLRDELKFAHDLLNSVVKERASTDYQKLINEGTVLRAKISYAERALAYYNAILSEQKYATAEYGSTFAVIGPRIDEFTQLLASSQNTLLEKSTQIGIAMMVRELLNLSDASGVAELQTKYNFSYTDMLSAIGMAYPTPTMARMYIARLVRTEDLNGASTAGLIGTLSIASAASEGPSAASAASAGPSTPVQERVTTKESDPIYVNDEVFQKLSDLCAKLIEIRNVVTYERIMIITKIQAYRRVLDRIPMLYKESEAVHHALMVRDHRVSNTTRLAIYKKAVEAAMTDADTPMLPPKFASELRMITQRESTQNTLLLLGSNTGTGKSTLAIMMAAAIAKFNQRLDGTTPFKLIYAAAASIGADVYYQIEKLNVGVGATLFSEKVASTVTGDVKTMVRNSSIVICTHDVALGLYDYMRRNMSEEATRTMLFIDEPTYDIGNYREVVNFLFNGAQLAPASLYSLMMLYMSPMLVTYAGASIFSEENMIEFMRSLDARSEEKYLTISEQSGQIFMSTQCFVSPGQRVALWDYLNPRDWRSVRDLANAPLTKRLIHAKDMLLMRNQSLVRGDPRLDALGDVLSIEPNDYDGSLIAEITTFQRLNMIYVGLYANRIGESRTHLFRQNAELSHIFTPAYSEYWREVGCSINARAIRVGDPEPPAGDSFFQGFRTPVVEVRKSIFTQFKEHAERSKEESLMIFDNSPIELALRYLGVTREQAIMHHNDRVAKYNAARTYLDGLSKLQQKIATMKNNNTETRPSGHNRKKGEDGASAGPASAGPSSTGPTIKESKEMQIAKIGEDADKAEGAAMSMAYHEPLDTLYSVFGGSEKVHVKDPVLFYLLMRGCAVLCQTSTKDDIRGVVEYMNRKNLRKRLLVFSDVIGAYGMNIEKITSVYIRTSFAAMVSEETIGQALSRVGRRGISKEANAYLSNLTMLRLATNCRASQRPISLFTAWYDMAKVISESSDEVAAATKYYTSDDNLTLITNFITYVKEYVRVELADDPIPTSMITPAVPGEWGAIIKYAMIIADCYTQTNELNVAHLFSMASLDKNRILNRLVGSLGSSIDDYMKQTVRRGRAVLEDE